MIDLWGEKNDVNGRGCIKCTIGTGYIFRIKIVGLVVFIRPRKLWIDQVYIRTCVNQEWEISYRCLQVDVGQGGPHQLGFQSKKCVDVEGACSPGYDCEFCACVVLAENFDFFFVKLVWIIKLV